MTTQPTKFIITFDGEPVEVPEPGLSVLVRFEKHFGLPASVLDPEVEEVLDSKGEPVLDAEGEPKLKVVSEFKLEWLCFLLYRQVIKAGIVPADTEFDDDFIDRITDVDAPDQTKEEVTDAVDPSVPAPSIG